MSTKALTRSGALATALILGLTTAAPGGASAAPAERKVRPVKKAQPTWHADRLIDEVGDRGAAKRPRGSSPKVKGDAARSLAGVGGGPDVTGDGRADLVAQFSGAQAGAIRIYDNSGSTTANPWTATYRTTATSWEFADLVVLADVTGDGKADLIVRDPGVDGGTLWVYPNNGNPADPWTSRVHAGTGWNLADTIRVGDVTGDGKADLLVRDPSNSSGTLWVYRGNGSTTSNPWTQSPIWSGTGWNLANALMLGDATGDDKLDIVARDGSGNILVYPHNGATTSNFWTSIVTGATGFGLDDRLELADVTADGRPDIVARSQAGTLRVYPSLAASGTMWSPSTSFAAGSGFSYAAHLLVGDVDGDGRPELAGRNGRGENLYILPNNGSSTGNPWTSLRAAGTEWGFAAQILVDDVNGDGRQDVIALDRAAANGTLWIYLHNGATSGNPWPSRYFAGTGWNTFNKIIAGDVTGDGRTDIVGRLPGGDLYAYPGNGSTTSFPWDPRVWVGSNWQQATQLALHDIDEDGYADLVGLESDGSLWVFPTATGDPIPIGGSWSGVASLDVAYVDGTGHPDLVVRDTSGSVWIHPGNGATTSDPWTAPRRFGGNGFESAVSFGM